MNTLAHFCFRHRKAVALSWVTALILIVILGNNIGSAYSSSFTLPNTESKIALDLIAKNFPTNKGATVQLVFASRDGTPLTQDKVAPAIAKMKTLKHVVKVDSPFDPNSSAISKDGTIAFASIHLDDSGQNITVSEVKTIIQDAKSFTSDKIEIELLGEVISKGTQVKPGSSEIIALLAAAIILFITFGSLISMLVPIGVAVVALGISSSLGGLMSHALTTADFAPILSALVGLGVGLDYALFIVTRYRQSLHAGESVEDSVATAIRTSGKAVLFAGIIVCIALLGLFTVGVSFLYGVALAASVSVLITMFASLTLLPAILGMVGHRIDKFSIPGRQKNSHEIDSGAWAKWAGSIQKRPLLWVIVSGLMILILCIPVFNIRIGSADAGNDPKTSTTRLAYDLLDKGFGPGYAGPLTLVSTIPNGSQTQTLATLNNLQIAISKDVDVERVTPAFPSPNGKIAIITVLPKSAPQDVATTQLIHRLRSSIIPSVMKGSNIHVYVGGIVAIFQDFGSVLTGKLPVFIGSVVLLSFLLLMLLFRSILIPLKAALMNILSISAAFGVVVAGFQWGWLDPILGGHGGPIESFLPIILFAILFGLSMDYEVFLVSRIQEEWLATKDNSLAVRRGLSSSGLVITSAALIMMSVFGSFSFSGQGRIIELFGIGLFTAILIDATIIRSALVPALMQWWGPVNWWLPKWLDKILPRVSVENSKPNIMNETN